MIVVYRDSVLENLGKNIKIIKYVFWIDYFYLGYLIDYFFYFDLIYDLKILMDYIRIFNSLVEILDKIDMF